MTLRIRPNAIEQDHGPFTFPGVRLPNDGLHILDTDASHHLIIKPGSDLSADRILTITTGDAARTITLSGDPTLGDWFDQSVKQASSPTFGGITIADGGTIGQAAGPLLTFDDTNNFLEIIGCRVGIGTSTPEGQLEVSDLAVDVTTTYFGGRFNHIKTAGATDTSDLLYGLRVRMELDQSGGVISNFNALDGAAIMTDGEVGQSGTLRHLRGNIFLARQDGGTVWGDVTAGRYNVDLNAGTVGRDVFGLDVVMLIDSGITSIGRDIYGARIYLDADQDPVGTAYGLYISCLSNVDYGIYQFGATADNYFAGDVGIGTATPRGKLHVVSSPVALYTPDANADEVVVENAGNSGLSIISSNTTSSTLALGNQAVPFNSGFVGYANSHASRSNQLAIYTNTLERVTVVASGNVGIGAIVPLGKTHIDQASSTGAIPVLFLDQADISEEFIKFVGAAAAGVLTQSIVDEGDQASETREGWLKVEVEDVGDQIADQAYYVPIYSLAA